MRIANKEGAISQLRISSNEQHIAVATDRGGVAVICLAEGHQVLHASALHAGGRVTALAWNGDASKVFVGDALGKVSVIKVSQSRTKMVFKPACEQLLQLDSQIVQIDCASSRVLISTLSRSYLYNVANAQSWHIGKKMRNGHYGACFLASPPSSADQRPIVFCGRPGARLWECDFDGGVYSTHQFNSNPTSGGGGTNETGGTNGVPPSNGTTLNGGSTAGNGDGVVTEPGGAETVGMATVMPVLPVVSYRTPLKKRCPGPVAIHFRDIHVISDDFILCVESKRLSVLDARKAQFVIYCPLDAEVSSYSVCERDIFLLLEDGTLRKLSLYPCDKAVSKLRVRRCYLQCMQLMQLYFNASGKVSWPSAVVEDCDTFLRQEPAGVEVATAWPDLVRLMQALQAAQDKRRDAMNDNHKGAPTSSSSGAGDNSDTVSPRLRASRQSPLHHGSNPGSLSPHIRQLSTGIHMVLRNPMECSGYEDDFQSPLFPTPASGPFLPSSILKQRSKSSPQFALKHQHNGLSGAPVKNGVDSSHLAVSDQNGSSLENGRAGVSTRNALQMVDIDFEDSEKTDPDSTPKVSPRQHSSARGTSKQAAMVKRHSIQGLCCGAPSTLSAFVSPEDGDGTPIEQLAPTADALVSGYSNLIDHGPRYRLSNHQNQSETQVVNDGASRRAPLATEMTPSASEQSLNDDMGLMGVGMPFRGLSTEPSPADEVFDETDIVDNTDSNSPSDISQPNNGLPTFSAVSGLNSSRGESNPELRCSSCRLHWTWILVAKVLEHQQVPVGSSRPPLPLETQDFAAGGVPLTVQGWKELFGIRYLIACNLEQETSLAQLVTCINNDTLDGAGAPCAKCSGYLTGWMDAAFSAASRRRLSSNCDDSSSAARGTSNSPVYLSRDYITVKDLNVFQEEVLVGSAERRYSRGKVLKTGNQQEQSRDRDSCQVIDASDAQPSKELDMSMYYNPAYDSPSLQTSIASNSQATPKLASGTLSSGKLGGDPKSASPLSATAADWSFLLNVPLSSLVGVMAAALGPAAVLDMLEEEVWRDVELDDRLWTFLLNVSETPLSSSTDTTVAQTPLSRDVALEMVRKILFSDHQQDPRSDSSGSALPLGFSHQIDASVFKGSIDMINRRCALCHLLLASRPGDVRIHRTCGAFLHDQCSKAADRRCPNCDPMKPVQV